MAGYVGFGSFHSDNVEKAIILPSSMYTPPPVPFDEDAFFKGSETFAFGKEARKWFMIDFDKWTFVNHGAFGAAARPAFQAMRAWQDHMEAQPLAFIDRELLPQLVRVIREVADLVGSRPQDVVFTANATTGINAVVKSAGISAGDVVYMLDIGYGSTKKILGAACTAAGAVLHIEPVPFPLTGEAGLVDLLERTLPAEGCRLCVLDWVTSNTAVRLPIKRMVDVAKSKGVRVLVDGAHALGMMPIDLKTLGADYFVANCHKWLCSPKSAGVLWVSPPLKHTVPPPVISHGHGEGFTSEFIWDGTRDHSAELAVSTAMRFWRMVGAERAREYMRGLLSQAAELLCGAWRTGLLAPLGMCGTMAMVRLPVGCWGGAGVEATSEHAKAIQDRLFSEHIEAPIKTVQGELFVRVSAHVYNSLEDYHVLAGAIARIAAEGGSGGAGWWPWS